jgi:hypothetical protein
MDAIVEMVRRCEKYADELFSENVYFTSITKFDDGDFRVETRHGMGHDGANNDRDDAYRQRYESITYVHTDGEVIYANRTRYIDAQFTETHEREVLE